MALLDSTEALVAVRLAEARRDQAVSTLAQLSGEALLDQSRREADAARADAQLDAAKADVREKLADLGLRADPDSLLALTDRPPHVMLDRALSAMRIAKAASSTRQLNATASRLNGALLQHQRQLVRERDLELAAARGRLGRLSIQAPASGRVLSELPTTLIGAHLNPGDPLLAISSEQWLALLTVDQGTVYQVHVGDTVDVEVPAVARVSTRHLVGRIEWIGSAPVVDQGSSNTTDTRYRVRVALVNRTEDLPVIHSLRSGFVAKARIISGRRTLAQMGREYLRTVGR
ncbi:MAG: HlyD family secretion protein [Gemmatimonadaceae bacterium]